MIKVDMCQPPWGMVDQAAHLKRIEALGAKEMMTEHLLTFVTAPIEDDQLINSLMELLDASVTVQGGLTTVEMLMDGPSGFGAAKTGYAALETLGVTVLRLMPDLVNMATIATRAGVSRQAVSTWLKDSKDGFPEAFALAGSGPVWDGAEINRWLRSCGVHESVAWDIASVTDAHRFTNWLINLRRNGWSEPSLGRTVATFRNDRALASGSAADRGGRWYDMTEMKISARVA